MSLGVAMMLTALQACNSGDIASPLVSPTSGPQTPVQAPSSASPVITAVLSDTAVAGSVISISGRDLPASASELRVTLGGHKLELVSVSPTRIDALVSATAFACAATTALPLEVVAGSTRFTATVRLRTARLVELAAGQSISANGQLTGCIELPATNSSDSKFVVAVVNASTRRDKAATIKVTGIGGHTSAQLKHSAFAVSGAMTGAMSGSMSSAMSGATPSLPSVSSFSAADQADIAHGKLLADAASIAAHAGSIKSAWAARSASMSAGLMNIAAARSDRRVGATVPMTALYAGCNSGSLINARVVYSGTRTVILEDIAAPKAGSLDAEYKEIGREFDSVVYPMLVQSVGDPLAMNSAMHGDGRITMLFTPYVNDSVPATAAYVSACNFYPRSTFKASNEDAVFYGRVVMPSETPAEWRRSMRSTVVHEVKHLASFAERFSRGASFEEPWLEEATARVAEELYSRKFPGGGSWRGHTGFAGSVGCELLQCDDRPIVMWKHFSQLYNYLRSTEAHSPFGASNSSDVSYYASGWSLVRHMLDRYAADESMSLKRLVRGDAGVGMAALASVSGTDAGELLSSWAVSNTGLATGAIASVGAGASGTSAQNTANGMASEAVAPSWDLASIWDGLSRMYNGLFNATPLRSAAYSMGSSFVYEKPVVAGGVSYIVLDGAGSARSQVLNVGSAEPGEIAVAITRVR